MRLFVIVVISLVLACCKKSKRPPIDDAIDLDGTKVSDSSLIVPSAFLLSAGPAPDETAKRKKVIIAIHGFSASNFEWQELASWSKTKPDLLVSRVLLGGHGRDYEDFKKATWQDWQAPILEEVSKLKALGYAHVGLAASSTGCPLVMDLLSTGKLSSSQVDAVFFIDPIIIPSNKLLSLAPAVGGTVIDYTESTFEPGEVGYWYRFRPHEALKQLNKLTIRVRKQLEDGVALPDKFLYVYKTEKDDSADPVSAVVLEKGAKCTVRMIPSSLHVFTRLKGRREVTGTDRKYQEETFGEIYSLLGR